MIELNDLTTYHIVLQLYMLPYLLSNVLIFNAILSLDHRLRKDLLGIRFVDYFLKPHYTSHIIKYISSLAVEALPCNSTIHYVTPK